MTAEAGECNGRSEGSKVEFEGSKGEFERKRGGDLKDADIASRDGEEIGGSFVIVNGDSDDHSDRDLDLEEKSDPSPAAENGELKPENGEIGGKEESLAENGVEEDEKFSEENVGRDDKLEEKRSNGADIDIQEEKEEAEVDAEHELNVVGSGSDIKAEQGQESVSEAKLDSDAQMKREEVEDDVDTVEVEESEKKDNVESGSDVKVEHEAETVDGKDLGSSDPVEANQDSEASSVVAEEKEEVLPRVEEQEREAEVLTAESDAKEGLGSEVEEEDIKEPELVVTETDCLMKSESVSLVGEEQEPASVMAEADDKGDVGEESQNSVKVVGETENAAESDSAVETEPKQEPQTVVEQTGNVAELESAVEELKQESDTGVEETEDSTESGSAVDVEPVQEPETVVAEIDKAEVEELNEAKVLVEENENQAETELAVEVEPEREPEIVIESAVLKSAEKIDAEERKEHEDVGTVNTALDQLPLDNGVPGKPNAVGDPLIDEPSGQLENGCTDSAAEISGDSLKHELNGEARNIPLENPETVVAEIDKAEVEEPNEAKVLVEKNENQAETELAVEVEPEREPEILIESAVLKSAEKIDAEERKEHEDVGTVNTALDQLPLDNGVPGKPNAVRDPLIDEPSGQLENGCTDSAAEISGDSLKHELNGEARNIPLENSESSPMPHVVVTELVEEVSHSSDDNIVKLEDNNEGMIMSQAKTDLSSKERSLSDLDTGGDLEPQSEDLRPHKDTETEAKDPVEDVEADKEGVAVDRMKQESESGNKSAKGSECMVSSIEGDQSANKDDDKEPVHEQAQTAEMIQAPPETNIVTRQQVYMIKVPRFIDDELQKKIQEAGSEVQKKTDEREEISKETRKQAEIVNKYLLDYKAELAKERAARAVFTAKRQELESKQELISRINNANSIADIDEKIRNMVHRQQHETISLKQEKQYIHDINQMKRLREQLSSKRASQEKIDEALSQRDEVEVKLKNLKKELDLQRAALSSAENSTKSAWNKYMDEVQCLRNLKEKHNAADGERQEAYLRLKKLRDQSAEKAKHFKMYKADQSAATNYIFSGDNQGLRSHCSNQVERILDLWNNNAEFREQYVKYNMYSTLRRLGTSDGRSLGPGEEAPILQSHLVKMSSTISAPSSKIETPAPSSKLETPAPVFVAEVRQGNLTESSAAKQAARTNLSAKSKSSTKPAIADHNMPTVSNSEASKEAEKENKLKKEEEELARKADELARKEEELRKEKAAKEEELREEKAAAELKEQLRLEQKAKAREAEERKRRKAEKAQEKAEYRAQKEAELKEKKKAKKETKKSSTVDATNGGTEGGSTPVSDTTPPETSQEHEISSAATSKKRSARPASSMRQYNKVQAPVPLPLRNRGKRKMTTWMWVLLVILLVLILFFAGNYISFSLSHLPDFGF